LFFIIGFYAMIDEMINMPLFMSCPSTTFST
jgi:hypothetical protein